MTKESDAYPRAVTEGTPLAMSRTLPRIDDLNRDFWTGGAWGELRIYRCTSCGLWIHPPLGMCRRCHSRSVRPEAVSGRGTIFALSVNHHPWKPGLPLPYLVALVELVEQADVRLVSNIVNCPLDSVSIGQPVRVVFERHDDIYLPLFEPYSEVE